MGTARRRKERQEYYSLTWYFIASHHLQSTLTDWLALQSICNKTWHHESCHTSFYKGLNWLRLLPQGDCSLLNYATNTTWIRIYERSWHSKLRLRTRNPSPDTRFWFRGFQWDGRSPIQRSTTLSPWTIQSTQRSMANNNLRRRRYTKHCFYQLPFHFHGHDDRWPMSHKIRCILGDHKMRTSSDETLWRRQKEWQGIISLYYMSTWYVAWCPMYAPTKKTVCNEIVWIWSGR